MKRSPAAAVWLSLLPGLGHLYVGYASKGLALAVLAFSVIQITSESDGPVGIFIPFVWLYAMIDAHRSAVEVNSGGALPRVNFELSKWWGYLLIGLGALLVLENFGLIDFDWVFRLWPLALIAMGVYILRRKPSSSGASPADEATVEAPPSAPPEERSSETDEGSALVEHENV